MNERFFSSMNWISVFIVILFAASIIQGLRRGASGSAKRLLQQITDVALTLLSLYAAWLLANWGSPKLQAT